jgi:AraC-like DNA-binding protein/ligand-binding sensor protein
MINDHAAILEALAASETYIYYARAFREATGLSLALRAAEDSDLAWSEKAHGNAFCELVARKNPQCVACVEMRRKITDSVGRSAVILKCRMGLMEAAVPVKVGGETIGYLVTGQVFAQPPKAGQFEKVARLLEQSGIPGDAKMRAAYGATRVIERSRLVAMVELLAIFAVQLAERSNQIVMQQVHAEPAAVTRAKHYIREHLGEDLKLVGIARAAAASTFYLCKLFRKYVGMNITAYISRLRVERTKELLMNPQRRVSEIAYEVGFQSLTHFNRVFRQIVGEAPRQHREALSLQLAA